MPWKTAVILPFFKDLEFHPVWAQDALGCFPYKAAGTAIEKKQNRER
jgi:hypothetical protein